MAVPVLPLPLTPSEIAQIPSASIPIGPQITHLLSEFTSLSIQLFTLLSSPSRAPSNSSTAPIYLALSHLDAKLARLLAMLATHQARQSRIAHLIETLRTLDQSWHSSAQTLHRCVAQLDPIVTSGASDRAAIASASSSDLTAPALLSYARLLAPFTSAPPSSLYPPEEKLRGVGATDPTGRSLPPGAIPPFPTEAAMRRGRLQFGREAAGMGETNEVGARRDGAVQPDQGPAQVDAAIRLEREAKRHEAPPPPPVEEETFDFDLDLNPDL
ncbi:hypothetical protein JCM1840_004612 [Sporobolomyces johnsonii]